MNTYIVGAFDGLIRENILKMYGMSSSKIVCHFFVTILPSMILKSTTKIQTISFFSASLHVGCT